MIFSVSPSPTRTNLPGGVGFRCLTLGTHESGPQEQLHLLTVHEGILLKVEPVILFPIYRAKLQLLLLRNVLKLHYVTFYSN